MGAVLPEGFKNSPVGIIPCEWGVHSISDSGIEIIDGDRGTHYPKQTDFLDEGFCLFLSAKNVTKNGFSFNECQFISKEKDDALRKGKLRRGDLVITTRGTVGNIAFYNDLVPFSEMRINSGMAIIRVLGSSYSSSFTSKLLDSPLIESQLSKIVSGSAQPQLTIKVINELIIPTPPLPEQKKIARILSTVDSRLALIDQQVTATQTLKKGLMQKLFSEGVGTQDDSSGKEGNWQPHTEFKDSELGRIPAGWKVHYVGEALSIRNTLRKPISRDERKEIPGPYPYYGPTKQQDSISTYEQDGTFALIGEDGDHFLKFAFMPMTQLVHGKCTVNNHAHVLASTETCSAEWFYHYFMNRDIVNFLTRQGAGRYKLNKAALEKLKIAFPPENEREEISKIIATMSAKLDHLTTQKTQTEQLKKGLMQKLLTGQIRVKPDPQDH